MKILLEQEQIVQDWAGSRPGRAEEAAAHPYTLKWAAWFIFLPLVFLEIQTSRQLLLPSDKLFLTAKENGLTFICSTSRSVDPYTPPWSFSERYKADGAKKFSIHWELAIIRSCILAKNTLKTSPLRHIMVYNQHVILNDQPFISWLLQLTEWSLWLLNGYQIETSWIKINHCVSGITSYVCGYFVGNLKNMHCIANASYSLGIMQQNNKCTVPFPGFCRW